MQISGDLGLTGSLSMSGVIKGLSVLGALSKYPGFPTEKVDCEFSSSFYTRIRYLAGSDN